MSERVVVVVAALAAILSGCGSDDDIRGLDEACVVCAGGPQGGEWVGVGGSCTSWRYFDCEEGLYCNLWSQVCKVPAAEGDGCRCEVPEGCDQGTECADGLVCNGRGTAAAAELRGTCVVPTPAGERCDIDTACVEGTTCNGAGAPDDVRAGTCEPPATGEGAPCAWAALGSVMVGGTGYSDGVMTPCPAGLVCTPPERPDAQRATFSEDPTACCSACDEQPAGCLGQVGACAPAGVGAPGDACVVDAGCASGYCKRLPPPVVWGGDGARLVSPWPGECATTEQVRCMQSSQWCDPQPCAAGAGECLPGELCYEDLCFAILQRGIGDDCGSVNQPGDDRMCAIGLACDVDTLRCRLAGEGQAGASCETSEGCAAALACFGGRCVTLAGAGESCDGRACAFELRCNRDALTCETPGTGHQGAPCQTDAACGNKLFCSQNGTCEWLAGGLIAECSDTWRPCDVGMACDMSAGDSWGTCVRE